MPTSALPSSFSTAALLCLHLALSTASTTALALNLTATTSFHHIHPNSLDFLLSTTTLSPPLTISDPLLRLPVLHRHSLLSPPLPFPLRLRDLLRLNSTSNSLQPHDLSSEVISGFEQYGSGEYFVRVGVGTPPLEQLLVVDSGSDTTWLQCLPCSQCYPQSVPLFDPSSSSSFSPLPCSSPSCSLLPSHSPSSSCPACRYHLSYRDGSSTAGNLALETLTFGSASVRDVAIGCGHRNRGLFVGAAGVLGLGAGPTSLVGQLGGAFSYCLVSRGGGGAAGSLVLGRAAAIPTGAAWLPLVRETEAPGLYYVALAGVGVAGVRLPLPEWVFEAGMVMDTGTVVTRLPAEAYAALRWAYGEATPGLPRAEGVSMLDTCYDLSGFESVRVPTVSFYFVGGTVLTLPARNLLIPVDEEGTYCLAMAAGESGTAIMGNIQQEGIQITFDAASGYVGFGPHTC